MPPTPIPTLTHTFPSTSPQSPSSTLQLLQHLTTSLTPPPLTHALIFLGGLGDTPLSIPYVRSLATSPVSLSEYTIFELRLSSSSSAFGYSSLKQDASEIRDCVLYLRSVLGVQKIVLMGHSTGCQDCLEYALNYGRASEEGGRDAEEERVDGVILQGPVSDREAIGMSCGDREVEESLKVARELIEQGKEEEIMPKEKMPEGWRGSPVSAYRWWSLAGVGGDDDYFSSDLSDEKLQQIWGRLEQKVLILPSEKDEWVPASIDKEALMRKWMGFCAEGAISFLSDLIPGANHKVEETLGETWLTVRVREFLEGL